MPMSTASSTAVDRPKALHIIQGRRASFEERASPTGTASMVITALGEQSPFSGRHLAPLAKCVIEINQHDHAGLGGDTCECDEADRDGHRKIEPHAPQHP